MEKYQEEIIVNNPHGLHARPASILVRIASEFDSAIKLEKDGETVDGKSIIAILSLGINKGMKVKLIIEGDDASEALGALRSFLEKGEE